MPIIKRLQKDTLVELVIYLGGQYKDSKFSIESTDDIYKDARGMLDFVILKDNGEVDIIGSIAKEFSLLNDVFKKERFDLIIALGDRWELLSLVYAASLSYVPVFHLCGGEDTIGAIDNQIRNAITKLSHIHGVANEIYAENISRMGEEDWRIVVCGTPGVENIKTIDFISREDIYSLFKLSPEKRYILLTYHPETDFANAGNVQILENILEHLSKIDVYVVATYPGLENESAHLINCLKQAEKESPKFRLFSSLGMRRYLSAMKYSAGVVGNSSSGILEAPYLNVPTINIGRRQIGRCFASSIIQVDNVDLELDAAIEKILNDTKFEDSLKSIKTHYGNGQTSEIIHNTARALFDLPVNKILQKKTDWKIESEKWNTLNR